jgi:polysaccharide biosynthesis protein PslG
MQFFKFLRKSFLASLLVLMFTANIILPALAAPLYKDSLAIAGLFPWASNWRESIVRSKNLGFTMGRMDFLWHWVEKSPGVYDFSFYDGVYNYMTSNGLRPIFILAYNNTLYGGSNTMNGISTQANRDAYARFVKAAAARYKGKGVIWEVWNEPDLAKFWASSPNPTDYAKLAQAAITAIRQGDPNAYVISAGFGHKYWNREYIRQTLSAGMLKGYNALAVHSYDYLNPPMIVEQQESHHATLRQWMSQYNGGAVLPIIDTEQGFKFPRGSCRQTNHSDVPKQLLRWCIHQQCLWYELSR